jgi:hypothetical protein
LRSSVDAARIEVRNSTVFVEDGNSRGGLDPRTFSEFRRLDDAQMLQLPYTSVNVVAKNVDQPLKFDDFRSGENDDSYDIDDTTADL